MQDKDIDQLFRSELADLDVQPSPAVWNNINQTLDAGKHKKAWLRYLNIAASILVIMAVGLYFIPKMNVTQQKPEEAAAVKNNKPIKTLTPPAVVEKSQVETLVPDLPIVAKVAFRHSKAPKLALQRSDIILVAVQDKTEQPLVQNDQRDSEIIRSVVPGIETRLTAQADISEQGPIIREQPLTLDRTESSSKVFAANTTKKHRINSLGDLINVVVSKVDKRKDKIIEFSGTDDDESTISAVNLGFIKIKKQD